MIQRKSIFAKIKETQVKRSYLNDKEIISEQYSSRFLGQIAQDNFQGKKLT